jgi:glycosyltransferase involved in cell wall biosynthesis
MYLEKTIGVVIPAYNEEKLIANTLTSLPSLVDTIIVVDDGSNDNTAGVVRKRAEDDRRIVLIQHRVNEGVGGAIVTGYKKAVELEIDVTAVMAGDGQMDPRDLKNIVRPVAKGDVDYTKGNRLFQGDAWNMIPHYRYLGNSFLSLLTKIASGYWHIADSQTGYTAISLPVLRKVNLDTIYKRYGMPNDILIRLNQYDFRVRDIHVRPVYGIGEKSGMSLLKVIPKISWLLFKGFWRRLFFKYVIKDFHPLIFFYILGLLFGVATVLLFARLFYIWLILGLNIPKINALAAMFSFMSSSQFTLFAMWFDMEQNKHLR